MIKVVQWTTGNVGKESAKAIVSNPGLDLVGCYAWSAEKVGTDVGDLVGIDPVGVAATDDAAALLDAEPDCVVYNPMWPSVDELIQILASGVNVVTTAAFITGRRLGADRQRILDACEQGGSTIMGTGISPGFVELVAITAAGVCTRIDKVTIREQADTTLYDSPETEKPAGFGLPIDHPDLEAMAHDGTAVFGEAVAMVADALGVELDAIVCEAEFARTTEDVEMASWTIAAGCVAGMYVSWQGRVGGRTLVELTVRWKKGTTLEPNWDIDADGHSIQIDGLPTVTASLGYLPPADFEGETIEDFMTIGHIITAIPAVNAIPAAVAARPGIITYADLDFPMPRGWVNEG